jgi:hypothetical protein
MTVGNRAAKVETESIQYLFVADVWSDPFFDDVPELP